MPFLTGSELEKVYAQAKKSGYGFIASNIAEPNTLIGVLRAARDKNSDLVLQLSNSASKFAGDGDPITGLRTMSNYIEELAENYDIGVFLNMDHLKESNMELIKAAIDEKLASSIMIDASKESFDDNVRITREVVEYAEGSGILIEGELGKIKGVEDEETASAEAFYTDPDEAVEYVKRTGIDLLAVSVGTQHGVSKGKDIELRVDLVEEINETLAGEGYDVPLVLHGSSGLVEEQLVQVLDYGVCKLNKDTRYQYEYARTALDFYLEHKDSVLPPEGVKDDREGFFSDIDWSPVKSDFDPRVVSRVIRDRIKETAGNLFEQAGSVDKSLYS
ncbi:MAG: class II fructose-bisphosphate aldolase [Candidatus Bipolaricaulota bacterium]|nr:class II fructose-bisphosphate aldolase [Candidatus Bipolaricaulota bacterium]MBS3791686.1 class II fructose-bisphosphate aldolase [Candidatus Bipolaricaulota bacterium]